MNNFKIRYHSPDASFLLLATRLCLNPVEAEKMEEILKQNPNWSLIRHYGDLLIINPLLYKHLSQERFSSFVPEKVMCYLESQYQRSSFKNLRIYGVISQLLERLQPYDIKVILLKGSFLARWIYRDIALRHLSDIDILIQKKDIKVLQQVLTELGYTVSTDSSNVCQSDFHTKFFAATATGPPNHLPPFTKPTNVRIEVHINPFAQDTQDLKYIEELWEYAVSSQIDGSPIYLLSPEHLLLHLCLHLYKHLLSSTWIPLYWFCDIYEFVGQYADSINWEFFYSLRDSLGVKPKVDMVINILRATYWHLPVPEKVFKAHDTKTIQSYTELLDGIVFKNQRACCNTYIKPNTYWETIKLIKQIKGWEKKIYFIIRIIFPKKRYLITRYPIGNPFIRFFYFYLVHPYKICKKFLLNCLNYASFYLSKRWHLYSRDNK